ncbi:MAG: glutamine-hydrolyzing GMP synthase [Spirochaetes bacterium]|nr:glutamine-hydrolyzing GMP synthase [Spirochaetota bacterium]
MNAVDKILILDFGSQSTQLIGRRIRQLGVYSWIVAGDAPIESIDFAGAKGIVFSGSPFSVYEQGAPEVDKRVYGKGLPILGICYGLQRIAVDHGGSVGPLGHKEYGRARVDVTESAPLFGRLPAGRFVSWMSHGDTVTRVPAGFRVVARSEAGLPAAFTEPEGRIWGVQFHPEASHCEFGQEILEGFVADICGARRDWTMEMFLRRESAELRETVGSREVVLLISGGVDSSVVAAMLLKSLDSRQVHLMYIDTGLMRLGESEEVLEGLSSLGARNVYAIDAREEFYRGLAGIEDPEQKRRVIGDLFIKVQEAEIDRRGIRGSLLAQGTLYTDLIESGKGVGNKANLIKTHHNVHSPLVEEKRRRGEILEPLSSLYKDEVRELGLALGLKREIVYRHPFPGPGLAVRILGEVTREKCDLLRRADALFIGELRARGLYDRIWQAFCVLLPIRSVGVSGDMRRYGHVLALRAVASLDAITADVYPFAAVDLLEISSLITNRIPEIGRVVYDISSKPPATIEWE